MKKVGKMPMLISRCKRAVYAIAAAVLAGGMFLGTGVTAEAVKLADVFDTKAYADSYPDLEAAFGDNWDAYVNPYFVFGAKEGRENFTDFDGLAYAERYPDLKEAYGDDLIALYRHYQAFGKDEGRNAETYDIVEDEDDEESLARVEVYTARGFQYVDEYNDAGILFRRTLTSYANKQVFDYDHQTGKVLRKYFLSLAHGNYYYSVALYDEEGNSIGAITTYYDKDGNQTKWEKTDKNGNLIDSSAVG